MERHGAVSEEAARRGGAERGFGSACGLHHGHRRARRRHGGKARGRLDRCRTPEGEMGTQDQLSAGQGSVMEMSAHAALFLLRSKLRAEPTP